MASRRQLISGMKVTSLGTLASRVLGMLRDMATTSLLGLSGGAMDALVLAFRLPNLFRGLFGEGALTASFVPVFSSRLEEGPAKAWPLLSAMLFWLSLVLAAVVLAGEAACGLLWWFGPESVQTSLTLKLTALLLPYLWFICLAAQLAATLQALGRFALPAAAPTLLSAVWLLAAWLIAPWFEPDKASQAAVLAAAILISGGLQLAVQGLWLWRLGFRFQRRRTASCDGVREIVRALGPTALCLGITRINTFLDSLVAWGLARGSEGPRTIAWLGGWLEYPLQQGAAAAIYCGERFCHFPIGLLGVAVATVIFPLLSRHAAQGNRRQLGEDLTYALRLVLWLGVPASAGLVLLAEPITRLLFERGEFTPQDTLRTSRVIAAYGLGVWACCALPVLLRGYYALGDRTTPLRVSLAAVIANLILSLALVWPLAEVALPISTGLCAAGQVLVLAWLFSRRLAPLDWNLLVRTALHAGSGTALMFLVGQGVLQWLPASTGSLNELTRVAVPLAVCLATYGGCTWLLGDRQWFAAVRQRPADLWS